MDEVKSIEIVAGAWKGETTTWDDILQRRDLPKAQLIFTSIRAVANAQDVFRGRILSKFQIREFLLNRLCLESNGFSGCEPVFDCNGDLEHFNHWSRFVVKQTYKKLHPKRSFTRFHSPLEKTSPNESPPPDPNTPIHSPQTIQHGWEWYEMGSFVHWTPHSTIILCFDLPTHLQTSLQAALTSSVDQIDFSDPYSVFSILLTELLSLYDSSVWSIRDHICDWEAMRMEESDYPLLHEIARHAIHVSETLSVASESVKGLQAQQQDFMAIRSPSNGYRSKTQAQFQFQLQLLQALFLRSESNTARLQNEIQLAFHTSAQRDSKIQVQIGKEAKKETSAMKAIAVVTMTFLPATFVSSVFSMSFFHFEPAKDGTEEFFTVANQFWMYWVLAAPLSLLGLGLWVFCDVARRERHREVSGEV